MFSIWWVLLCSIPGKVAGASCALLWFNNISLSLRIQRFKDSRIQGFKDSKLPLARRSRPCIGAVVFENESCIRAFRKAPANKIMFFSL